METPNKQIPDEIADLPMGVIDDFVRVCHYKLVFLKQD